MQTKPGFTLSGDQPRSLVGSDYIDCCDGHAHSAAPALLRRTSARCCPCDLRGSECQWVQCFGLDDRTGKRLTLLSLDCAPVPVP